MRIFHSPEIIWPTMGMIPPPLQGGAPSRDVCWFIIPLTIAPSYKLVYNPINYRYITYKHL